MTDYIRKVLDGDREAYRYVIREYGPHIRAYLAAHLSDPATIDDLAQGVFIAAYESLSRFDMKTNFARWIKGIAKNKLFMYFRERYQEQDAREKIKYQILEEVSDEIYEISADDHAHVIKKLRECLKQLPERAQDIISCRYLNKEKVYSIAERLKTTVSAVSSLLYRGKKLLESCMEGKV
ncbi:RNA polymerase sigma factor [Planctomycetota bacterium]